MGREHRLQGNARVREESDRRPARIPAPVPAEILSVEIARNAPIIGIDVGENYLDLAVIGATDRRLRYSRIDLTEVGGADPIGMLARALAERLPELSANAIAIVDSPRCPIDLDCSAANLSFRSGAPPTRAIDATLRTLVRDINSTRPLNRRIRFSLFPTPRLEYFARCLNDRNCKAHLRAFGAQLFRSLDTSTPRRESPGGGAIFTRFMLAGFAVHRALDALRVETYEGYPYLAFKLWMNSRETLPPKNRDHFNALRRRAKILRRLTAPIHAAPPATLDQADASILATMLALTSTSDRIGSTFAIQNRAEGRFLVAIPSADTQTLALDRASLAAAVCA